MGLPKRVSGQPHPCQARLFPRRQAWQALDRLRVAVQHEGCPVDVEVFEGNTADPTTVRTQLETLRERFALVGDRGLPTGARIREEVRPAGFDRITALRAPQNRALVDGGDLQLSLFGERDLAEISAPELYPGERLVVCRNPLLAAKAGSQAAGAPRRHRGRAATDSCCGAGTRSPCGPTGRCAATRSASTSTSSAPTDSFSCFSWERNEGRIAKETELDGIYIIRTDVPAETLRPRKQFGPERA